MFEMSRGNMHGPFSRPFSPTFWQVNVNFDPTPLHSEILASLAFHPAIISAAVNAIRQGRAGEEPFLAVHLRRNDMKNWVNRQHAWPSTDSVIEQVTALGSTNFCRLQALWFLLP